MKKIIAAAVATVFAAASVFAFDLSFGVTGNFNTGLGTNFSDKIRDEYKLDTLKKTVETVNGEWKESAQIGGGFSLFADFGILDFSAVVIGLRPEFSMNFNNGYEVYGKYTLLGNSVYAGSKVTTHTVDIPLFITVTVPLADKKFKLEAGFGPVLSIPVLPTVYTHKTTSDEWEEVTYSHTYYEDLKAQPNFGLAFDLNAGLKAGPGYFFFDVRYLMDLTTTHLYANKKSDNSSYIDSALPTINFDTFVRRTLNLGLGYEIYLDF